MNEKVLKITLAAFLHDIGKFAQDGMEIQPGFAEGNADLYQPRFKDRYTHRHALYTAAFLDHMEKILPPVFNKAGWGLEEALINLAAGHHKPERPLQWIIAMADRLSSGWDRQEFEDYNSATDWHDYRRVRLLSLFEHLGKVKFPRERDAYEWYHPLREISARGLFPKKRSKDTPVNDATAAEEYRRLFFEFTAALEKLGHRQENVSLWLEHLDSVMLVFISSIPAARAGRVIPDVSLYDHSRITAAIAAALYLYHDATATMTVEAIRDVDMEKFLLIGGDFYGIQDFIFSEGGETGKARSKILRGRSFAVSLFTELAADMICREIGLTCLSVGMNAAGKFMIIAPNTKDAADAAARVGKKVNDWLFAQTYGENALGIAHVTATPGDFSAGRFADLWEKLSRRMERRKFNKIDLDRLGGAVKEYLDSFRNDLKRPLCPFCGKRPSSPRAEGSTVLGDAVSACCLCRDHIFLGERLVKEDRIAVLTADAKIHGEENRLLEPVFGSYQVAFLSGGLKELAREGSLLKYWDISIRPDGTVQKDVTARFLNAYVPVVTDTDIYDERILAGEKTERRALEDIGGLEVGNLKTFAHIAAKSMNPVSEDSFEGVAALGVLKADVDNLGMLMGAGIPPELFTVSRMAALSRQLDFFFTVYLPHLLKTDLRFENVYTVFAGGDDLFLIGPWNRMVDLALHLNMAFAEYVCGNSEMHFSAGITIHKSRVPVKRLAEASEEALGLSKTRGRNRVTMFGETATWEEFAKMNEIKETLSTWWDNKMINSAMIYRLNNFIAKAEEERRVKARDAATLEDLESLKWRALFRYSVDRNVGRGLSEEEKRKAQKDFSRAVVWLEVYGGRFKMALWDVIYNKR